MHLSEKLLSSSLKPAFLQYVQQLSPELFSPTHFTATSIKRWNELTQKWIVLIPYFSFAYHASFSSDVLPSYWLVVSLFPFRDRNTNGPINTKIFIVLGSNSKKKSCNDNDFSLPWNIPMCACLCFSAWILRRLASKIIYIKTKRNLKFNEIFIWVGFEMYSVTVKKIRKKFFFIGSWAKQNETKSDFTNMINTLRVTKCFVA